MPGLANSRHAPRNDVSRSNTSIPPPAPPLTITPAPTGNGISCSTSRGPSPHPSSLATHELSRYTKIVRRLKWKLPFLATAYRQAVSRVGQDPGHVAEAELMFKLDFFEYYMLVERALVHLLGVYGIEIQRGARRPMNSEGGNRGVNSSLWSGSDGRTTTSNDDNGGGARAAAGHRYHANVLEALDNRDSPLHATLGAGEVRRQLGRAKDLRNRWKTAADDVDDGGVGPGRNGKLAAPLETYDFERILTDIFDGFDAAYLVAERFVLGDAGDASTDMALDLEGRMTEEEQWEFMVDAMDWEAV
ncbi:hypothetical protein B0T25DRAFT_532870 [Lasiosphaeria hispida]|uniref:Fungal specific transcription factor n=1 Tax=Lasiosphaeria hispida TaxID=260671 RepID=A0AAJ0HQQ3_9PEZI|nr:hypothetical protein B0T25DRAFT_532870 [Lasiosphaeria hispida]